jgi:glucokinase
MALRGGIDLGGTKIQAVVVNGRNVVVGSARGPTPREGGPPAVAQAMAHVLRGALEAAGAEPAELGGIGIGAPGAIDEATGVVSHSPNIPGWEGSFALGPALQELLGAPAVVGNDVDVATDAEFRLGAGRPYRSVLGVFWGTGVGGGLILEGKRYSGRGGAGEIGHTVVRIGGARCGCGRRGCLEAYAGRGNMELRARAMHERGAKTQLFKIMRDQGKERLASGVWEEALDRDDTVAIRLIDRAVGALGAGIASANNLLDVEAVVIGGGLGTRLGQPYADRILAAMLPHLFRDDDPPAVLVASLGDLGGAIGAALRAPRVAAPAAR